MTDVETSLPIPVKRWGRSVQQFPKPTTKVPAANYADPAHLQREIDLVLRRHWLFGGLSSELAEPGAFKVWEHLGDTVIIVRKADGGLSAFHNVCMHRGARIAAENGVCDRYFECKWHGWRYDEDGVVVRVPKREDFDPAELDGLRAQPVAVEEWRGTIWINLSGPGGPSLEEHLGELVDEWAPFHVEDMTAHHHQVRLFEANWKAVLDGFNEAYHGASTHQTFNDNQIWNLDQMSLPMMGLHDAFILPYRQTWDDIVETEDHHKYATCHYLAFPNTIFLFQGPLGLLNIMIAWPRSVGVTDFEFYLLHSPDTDPEWIDGGADRFNAVLNEDEYAMVQSGATLNSMAYTRNLFGRREGRLTNLAENLERVMTEAEGTAP